MIELKPLFTTQEQSKRLLELGVPPYTADLKYSPRRTFNTYYLADPADGLDDSEVFYPTTPSINESGLKKWDIPCWSLTRLFQILSLCYDHARCAYMIDIGDFRDLNMDDVITNDVEFNIKDGMLDFSKLNN